MIRNGIKYLFEPDHWIGFFFVMMMKEIFMETCYEKLAKIVGRVMARRWVAMLDATDEDDCLGADAGDQMHDEDLIPKEKGNESAGGVR